MQHFKLRNLSTFQGGFTDLYCIGTKRVLGTTPSLPNTSDLTAAATTQTITLETLAIGDVVVFPIAQAWVKQKFTDATTENGAAVTLANLKVDLGVTGTTTKFIAGTNGDLIQSPNYPITSVVAAGVGHAAQAAIAVLATFTSTAGNLSTVTFGDLFIYLSIARVGEWVRDRQA
jgi:hypothetical protein